MWFVIALVIGAVLSWLILWLRGRNISVTWYEWLIGLIGLGLLVFTIQNSVTAIIEIESQASWMFLVAMGLPAIILMVAAWQLIARRQQRAD